MSDIVCREAPAEPLVRGFSALRRLIGATTGCVALRGLRAAQALVILIDPGPQPLVLAPGLPMLLTGLPAKACGAARAVFSNHVVADDVPAALAGQCPIWENALWTPLLVGRSVLGVVGLGNKPGGFADRDTELSRACADVMASGLAHDPCGLPGGEQASHSEAASLPLDEIAVELATVFASASASELAEALANLLRKLCRLLDCDRAVWCRLDPVAGVVALDQVEPVALDPLALPADLAPPGAGHWNAERLLRGQVVALAPDPWPQGRMGRPGRGAEARLAVPIRVEGRASYMLGFETVGRGRSWPEPLIRRVRVVAELIGKAIERQRADEAAAELRRCLAHATRVMATAALAGAFAHELNQPLTAIVGNARAAAHLLAGADPDLEEVQEILGELNDEALRAGNIVAHMRGQLRRSTPTTEPLDLWHAVAAIAEVLASEAQSRRVDFHVVRSPLPATVAGDRVQLEQVVVNLVLNAFDAVADQPDAARQVAVLCGRDGTSALLLVEDTGPGLPPGRPESVFEPFATSKPGGLGLGLAISREIAAAHGGSVAAAHREGGGARFELRLPLLEPAE